MARKKVLNPSRVRRQTRSISKDAAATSPIASVAPRRPLNPWVIFMKEYIAERKRGGETIAQRKGMRDAKLKWDSLGQEERQHYQALSAQSIVEYRSLRPAQKRRKNVQPCVVTRCSPRRFMACCKQLTTDQRLAIDAIGFAPLLHLQCTSLIRELCAWLIQQVDVDTRSLKIGEYSIPIGSVDVSIILGLRHLGHPVITSGPDDIICEVRDMFQIEKHGIPLSDLESRMRSLGGGPEFKRAFVLFALGSLLCPNSNIHASITFLHSVVDVGSLSELNWAAFVVDRLFEEIKIFQIKKKQCIGGCLLFLQLFYYEHVLVGPAEADIRTPRLLVWTQERVKNREKAEKVAGGYGRGQVDPTRLRKYVESGNESIQESPDINHVDPPEFEDATAIANGDTRTCIANNDPVEHQSFLKDVAGCIKDIRSEIPDIDPEVASKLEHMQVQMQTMSYSYSSSLALVREFYGRHKDMGNASQARSDLGAQQHG